MTIVYKADPNKMTKRIKVHALVVIMFLTQPVDVFIRKDNKSSMKYVRDGRQKLISMIKKSDI